MLNFFLTPTIINQNNYTAKNSFAAFLKIYFGGIMKKIFLLLILTGLYGCNYESIIEPTEQQINYSGEYQTKFQDAQTVILYLSHDGKMGLTGSGNWNGMIFTFTGTVMNRHAIMNFALKKTSIGDLDGTIDGFFDESGKLLAGGYILRNEYNILQSAISFKLIAKANTY